MAQITTRKRGNYWEYSFEIASINGKRKRKSKSGFKTKKECLEAGAKAKAEYDSTGDVLEQSDISLVDYMNFWLDDYVTKNCKASTKQTYSQVIRLQITPYFGDIGIGTINSDGFDVVPINYIFGETINTNVEYSVFLQKEGQGDLWVDTKDPLFFIVKGNKTVKNNL